MEAFIALIALVVLFLIRIGEPNVAQRPQKAKSLCKTCFLNDVNHCIRGNFQYPKAKRCKEYIHEDNIPKHPPKQIPAILDSSRSKEEPAEPTQTELRALRQFEAYFED